MNSTLADVLDLAPLERAAMVADFGSGLMSGCSLIGPTAGLAGPRTYCDKDRMYVADDSQARVAYDHDYGRWGLRRDCASTNLVEASQYVRPTWGAATNGLSAITAESIPFLLESERAARFDHIGNGSAYAYPSPTTTSMAFKADTYYTASLFVKVVPGSTLSPIRIRLHPNAFGVYQDISYDPETDSVYGPTANVATTVVQMEKYPDGWRRIIITALTTAAANTYPFLLWPGGAAPGVSFWFAGAQLEELPFATSYIPKVTGKPAARADETGVMLMAAPNIVRGSVGTLLADFRPISTQQGLVYGIAAINRVPTSATHFGLAIASTPSARTCSARSYTYNVANAVTTNQTLINTLAERTRDVMVMTWNNTTPVQRQTHLQAYSASSRVNGAATFAGLDETLTAANGLLLGNLFVPTQYSYTGWIYAVKYYQQFFTDDELQNLVGIT